jgi:hypothetical protein
MSAGPSEQEDGHIERGLTYAFASTAAKTWARERHGFRRIAAPCQAARNKTAPDDMEARDVQHCRHPRLACDRSGEVPPRDAAISQAPAHDPPAQHY